MRKAIPITIETSARHTHLSRAHARKLLGKSSTLFRTISQIGQYAARETVTIKNGRKHIPGIRVVGPERKETQVELSLSDCRALEITDVPLKVSGSLKNTPGITIVGPRGSIKLSQGVIIAQRHIHCPPQKAKELGLKNGDGVSVSTKGKRGLIFENVTIRVGEGFRWRMHIDTDEANAAGIKRTGKGVVLLP